MKAIIVSQTAFDFGQPVGSNRTWVTLGYPKICFSWWLFHHVQIMIKHEILDLGFADLKPPTYGIFSPDLPQVVDFPLRKSA
jgi:hypothetical protein